MLQRRGGGRRTKEEPAGAPRVGTVLRKELVAAARTRGWTGLWAGCSRWGTSPTVDDTQRRVTRNQRWRGLGSLGRAVVGSLGKVGKQRRFLQGGQILMGEGIYGAVVLADFEKMVMQDGKTFDIVC